MLPSVPFLKPIGADMPDASSRCTWLSVVRAPMAPQLIKSPMYWGDMTSSNSPPAGMPDLFILARVPWKKVQAPHRTSPRNPSGLCLSAASTPHCSANSHRNRRLLYRQLEVRKDPRPPNPLLTYRKSERSKSCRLLEEKVPRLGNPNPHYKQACFGP